MSDLWFLFDLHLQGSQLAALNGLVYPVDLAVELLRLSESFTLRATLYAALLLQNEVRALVGVWLRHMTAEGLSLRESAGLADMAQEPLGWTGIRARRWIIVLLLDLLRDVEHLLLSDGEWGLNQLGFFQKCFSHKFLSSQSKLTIKLRSASPSAHSFFCHTSLFNLLPESRQTSATWLRLKFEWGMTCLRHVMFGIRKMASLWHIFTLLFCQARVTFVAYGRRYEVRIAANHRLWWRIVKGCILFTEDQSFVKTEFLMRDVLMANKTRAWFL